MFRHELFRAMHMRSKLAANGAAIGAASCLFRKGRIRERLTADSQHSIASAIVDKMLLERHDVIGG